MDNPDYTNLHTAQSQVLSTPPTMPNYLTGKSIVTSCYRAEMLSSMVLFSELNRLKIQLPVEVFYQDGEIDANEINEMSSLLPGQIQFKKIQSSVADFTDRWGNKKGWATKFYALLESEYAENLWIDSDNIPIKNCTDLFADQEYLSKGSLFWRDVYSIDRADQYHSNSQMWKIFDVTYNDAEPFESGQFLIDKTKVWQEFSVMWYFTVNNNIYYQFGGDAECWRMAWQLASIKRNGYHSPHNYHASPDVPYGFMPYGPFHKGIVNPWRKYGGGTVMVQRDRSGNELFNHRNIHKFTWTKDNPYNADVTNEQHYHMIIQHLMVKYGVIK